MAQAQASVVINKPVEEVFDYVCTPDNGPAYIPNLNENTDIQGEGQGQTYTWHYNMAGIDLTGKGEVTAYERPTRHEMSITGDIQADWKFAFAEADGGTKITVTVDYEISENALQRLANKTIIGKFNQKTAEQMMENLKTILES